MALLIVSPRDSVLVIFVGLPGVNTSVSFFCFSQGGPGNIFKWSMAPDGYSEFTDKFDRNIVVQGNELTVMNARFYVDRVLKCEVTNSAGSGSNVITITGS